MAETAFGQNDPRTQKKWSRKMFDYALDDFFFLESGFMGTGPNSIIQVLTELDGKHVNGSAITIELEIPLSGEGQDSEGTVTGNEEDMIVMNQTLTLGGRAHGVVSKGPLNEKRTATKFRELGKRQLGTWWRNICLEQDIWRSLYGGYNASGISTVGELSPSSDRILYLGQTAAGVLSASKTTDALLSAETDTDYLCGLKVLQAVRRYARLCSPKVRPIKVKGYAKPLHIVVLHPYQIKAIKNETGEHSYTAMMKDAAVRGKDNPLFKAAEFLYDGMLVFEYDRAPMRTGAGGTTPAEGFLLNAGKTATTDPVANGASVARGLLLGAQAGLLCWGQRPAWHEDLVDARKPQIVTDALYTASKTRFSEYDADAETNTAQQDYGVVAFDTQVIVD